MIETAAATVSSGFVADTQTLRKTMVECQIRTFGVTDGALIARMLEVPRENFLPEHLRALAYSDKRLEIMKGKHDDGRWLLPPLVLARLIQEGGLSEKDDVLDVAPGGGYSTALLAGLVHKITALEDHPNLHEALRQNLESNGLEGVNTVCGPLQEGAPQYGPYDVIFINGGVEDGLIQLAAQLKEGGRIMAIKPLENGPNRIAMKAVRLERVAGNLSSFTIFDAAAPLLQPFKKHYGFNFG